MALYKGNLSFKQFQTLFQSSGGECLQALFGVWLRALSPLSMAYGISHFHAVRRGVEAAQAFLPCLDSGLYKPDFATLEA